MANSPGRRVPRPAATVHVAALVVLFTSSAGLADVFYLRDGGQVEGEEISRAGQLIQVRTKSAQVALHVDEVVRVERTNAAVAIYQRLRKEYPPTADGHYRLAMWCRGQKLEQQALDELRAALALDPHHAPSHQALGHVRIGDAWLEPAGRPTTTVPPASHGPSTRPSGPPDAAPTMHSARLALGAAERNLTQMLRAEWFRRIRSIQINFLSSSSKRQFNQGAEMLRAIRDPLAVGPMLQLLSDGSADQRKLLVSMLGDFPVSAATMGLLEAAVLDDDAEVRRTALGRLAGRSDPRIVAFLLKALASEDEDVLRNAAGALGRLRVVDAVPALARELTGKEVRRVRTDAIVRSFRHNFIDDAGQLRTLVIRRRLDDPFAPAYQNVTVTVYRTEAQEALIAITGENYGFDTDAWLDWHRRYQARANVAGVPAPGK